MSPTRTSARISARISTRISVVGVHVLDTHVIGVESIPSGSDGQLVETIRMSAAGTAGGTGLVLARLGAEVSSFGAVGDDMTAVTLLALLAEEGVDVAGLVRKAEHQTSSSVIPVRPSGERPAWHCIGANGAFTLEDLDAAAHLADHVHLGGPEFLGGPAAGSLDVLAPGDPDMLAWIADALPHTDYLLPNDEQVLGFTGAADLASGARALVEAGAGCVAVTQGARGALVVTRDEVIEVPAYAVDVVDTTGCGDAFSAGFVLGRAQGRSLADSAALGCATAAQVAGGLGTDAGAYDLAAVEAFMAVTPTR